MLEYFFHKKELVSTGFRANHRYFSSLRKAEEYVNFDFPQKKEILELMIQQQKLRDILCYGKEKDLKIVEEAIRNLQKIKEIITKELGEEL